MTQKTFWTCSRWCHVAGLRFMHDFKLITSFIIVNTKISAVISKNSTNVMIAKPNHRPRTPPVSEINWSNCKQPQWQRISIIFYRLTRMTEIEKRWPRILSSQRWYNGSKFEPPLSVWDRFYETNVTSFLASRPIASCDSDVSGCCMLLLKYHSPNNVPKLTSLTRGSYTAACSLPLCHSIKYK